MAQSQRKTVMFYPALDVLLLREICAINPYNEVADKKKEMEKWSTIQKRMMTIMDENKCVTLRQCRERADKLLEKHHRQELESLRADILRSCALRSMLKS